MQIEQGAIVKGKVTGLTNFGAFVELENGTTGMVHISEVSNTYVKDINEHLTLQQEVQVKVLTVGDNGKISLSIKQLQEAAPAQQRRAPRPARSAERKPNVWQGSKPQPEGEQSFEDMMSRFKQVSDEKITDLKRSSESKRGGGYSRRK